MPESDFTSEGRQKIAATLAIILPVLFLSGLGIITLISAGAIKGDSMVFVQKQAVWLGIAVASCLFASFVNLDFFKKLAIPIALISITLLVIVLIPSIGREVNGARRWIQLGGFVFQPSDIAKIAIVICMATYLHANQRSLKTFTRGILIPFAITGVFCALMIKEPDFGTTALCGAVSVLLMFLAGVRKRYIAGCVILAIAAIGVIIIHNPNRMARLGAYLDREANAQGGTYQLTQAIYAFGAGGPSGVGLGQGRQQYSFIPEAHTDFIFANIGEELGLVGTYFVLSTFLFLFVAFSAYLRKAPNLFEFSIGLGAMLMIVIQALFNMGVVTGMLPTKGISLPFISYGGSNLVVMFFFSGILVNCVRRWNSPKRIKTSVYE